MTTVLGERHEGDHHREARLRGDHCRIRRRGRRSSSRSGAAACGSSSSSSWRSSAAIRRGSGPRSRRARAARHEPAGRQPQPRQHLALESRGRRATGRTRPGRGSRRRPSRRGPGPARSPFGGYMSPAAVCASSAVPLAEPDRHAGRRAPPAPSRRRCRAPPGRSRAIPAVKPASTGTRPTRSIMTPAGSDRARRRRARSRVRARAGP